MSPSSHRKAKPEIDQIDPTDRPQAITPSNLSSTQKIKQVTHAQSVKASQAIKATTASSPSTALDNLEHLDAQDRQRILSLLYAVDHEQYPQALAWDEILTLALTSSLNVPPPIAQKLLPRLKELVEQDPEIAHALKSRLGIIGSPDR